MRRGEGWGGVGIGIGIGGKRERREGDTMELMVIKKGERMLLRWRSKIEAQ